MTIAQLLARLETLADSLGDGCMDYEVVAGGTPITAVVLVTPRVSQPRVDLILSVE